MPTRNPFSTAPSSEAGYALVTVLVISMVISVITMSMIFSVREKITLAQELVNRNQACLKATSAFNQTLYNILTATFTSTGLEIRKADGKISANWNLYGEPLKIAPGVTVCLRDTAGMITLPFSSGFLRTLMRNRGHSSQEVNAFIDAFADWQDSDNLKKLNGAEAFIYRANGYSYTPRNFYIQIPEELKLLKGVDQELFSAVKKEFVYWGGTEINYLTMSEELLKACLQDEQLTERIIKLRKEGQLTAHLFQGITGVKPSDFGSFRPSRWIKIDLEAREGKAVDKISALIAVKQLRDRPFILAEWRK